MILTLAVRPRPPHKRLPTMCGRPTDAHHRQFERCLGACGARLSAATTRIRPFHTHFRKPITSRNTSVWDRSCWPFRAWSSSTEAVTGIGSTRDISLCNRHVRFPQKRTFGTVIEMSALCQADIREMTFRRISWLCRKTHTSIQ